MLLIAHLLLTNIDHSKNLQANTTGAGHQNSFNATKSYNTTYNTTYNSTPTDEQPEILKWLSPLESDARHEDVRNRRQDGLGDWFLQTQGFIKWRDCEDEWSKATLSCSGNPGVGKTFLR